MKKIIAKWFIVALALLLVQNILPGVSVSGFYIALVVAAILGLFNIFVRPILIILTLPVNILTFGLFTFVINGFLFWFVSTFIQGFEVSGFWVAVLAAAIVSVVSYLGDKLISKTD